MWGVQFAHGAHGQLLSCAADGTLVAWKALEAAGGVWDARTLVELSLPVNSLHLDAHQGLLASASDAQVLTFIDMREA